MYLVSSNNKIIIILTIMSIHILCRKYKEDIQKGMCPSQKRRLQDSNIGGGSTFPKFDDWIADAINYAKQQGQDITIEELDLSLHPHIYASPLSWMRAYVSHLRVEENDTERQIVIVLLVLNFITTLKRSYMLDSYRK